MPHATLRTVTLGCKVNQYETEYVRQGLTSAGYRDAAPDEPADLCIVNTCTVTSEGDSKSRQTIRRLGRRNPDARIIVMGCYATRAPEEVATLPGVVEVIRDKRELPDLLGRMGVVDVPTGISEFGNRHRAFVKVQDGCILRCSFCIIPTVRPGLTSRPADDIVQEVQRLVDHGHREVVLTGIHLGHYGVDLNRGRAKQDWVRLAQLLARIAELEGEFRVRLSSIEATELTRELLEVMAAHPKRICPHLHISMQSGSDAVLRRMRRRWGSRRFVDRCLMAREMIDRLAITTDIIVGFPGETEEDFEATCRVSETVNFSKIHIFPFSPRRTTPAATMEDQIGPECKAERAGRLAALEHELQQGYFASLEGTPLQVLVESPLEDRPGWSVGTSCRYAPVEIQAAKPGTMMDVIAGSIEKNRIQAASTFAVFSHGGI